MTKIVKGMRYNLSSESLRNVDTTYTIWWLGARLRAVGVVCDRVCAHERKRRWEGTTAADQYFRQ